MSGNQIQFQSFNENEEVALLVHASTSSLLLANNDLSKVMILRYGHNDTKESRRIRAIEHKVNETVNFASLLGKEGFFIVKGTYANINAYMNGLGGEINAA